MKVSVGAYKGGTAQPLLSFPLRDFVGGNEVGGEIV